MLYIIYKIINKVNNKFYIGVHQTKDINDNYMGSGININRAIEKYGLDNFEKNILYIFTNKKEAYLMEKQLVNNELLSDPMCYNIKEGGRGGFDHIWRNYNSKNYHAKNTVKIYHPISMQEKSVKKEQLDSFLNDGWVKGFSPIHLNKMSKSGSKKIQSKESRFKNSFRKKNGLIFIKDNNYKWLLPNEIDFHIQNGWSRFKRKCIYCSNIFEVSGMKNQLCSQECKRLRMNYLTRLNKIKK